MQRIFEAAKKKLFRSVPENEGIFDSKAQQSKSYSFKHSLNGQGQKTHLGLHLIFLSKRVTTEKAYFQVLKKRSEDRVDGVDHPVANRQVEVHHESLIVQPGLKKNILHHMTSRRRTSAKELLGKKRRKKKI